MDLIIRQSHELIKFSSTVPWDNNQGKTVIPHLLPLFIKKWSTHECKHPSCKRALNIDGNHKVTRLTCLFNEINEKSIEIQSNF